jgi:hypothetical protein
MMPKSIPKKALRVHFKAEDTQTPSWRRAEIASVNRHNNARSLVWIFSES